MRLLYLLILISSSAWGQTLTDDRDQKVYKIIQLGDLYWMTENLRYEAEGSVCLEDCDEIRFYDLEHLAEVCPRGWRLPEMNEWNSFIDSFQDMEVARMMEKNEKIYRVDILNKFNILEQNKLNITKYGRMEGGKLLKGQFVDYWTRNETTDNRFHMHITPYSLVGHSHKHHLKSNKPEDYRLFLVRCVCEASP